MTEVSSNSIYNNAPDLLLDKIAEVNSLLQKVYAKSGDTENFRFWRSVVDVMKYSAAYILDVKWIFERSAILKQENLFLKKYCIELEARLQAYEVIRQQKIAGTLEETSARVDSFLNDLHNDELYQYKKTKVDGQ